MVDPVTGAAIGGAANAVGNTVIEKIVKGDENEDYEQWQQEVIQAATEAEAARRYCIESAAGSPERSKLEKMMERYGKQAKKLEVIGERQGYPDGEVDTVAEFAQICPTYATVTKSQNLNDETTLSENLPSVVQDIFSFVE